MSDLMLDKSWVQNEADKTEYYLDKAICPILEGKNSLDISELVEKAGQVVQAIKEYLASAGDNS